MSRQKNRKVLRMIGLAAMAGLGRYNLTPDGDPPAGGGGGVNPKPPEKPPEPEKLTLTKEELKAQIDAALKTEREKAADDAKKERDEKERKDLEAKGEVQKLLDKEKEKAAELAAENRRLKLDRDLRDHLAEKHPEYATVAKYILPQIPADTKDADLKAAIELAAADYVKDNPREAKGGSGGAPVAAPKRGGNQATNIPPVNGGNAPPRQRFSTLRSTI